MKLGFNGSTRTDIYLHNKGLLAKIYGVDVDCASVLHFSMWYAAFLIVDVSLSIFKQSNLRMHCFSYFVWIRQKGLSKGLKEVHVMV